MRKLTALALASALALLCGCAAPEPYPESTEGLVEFTQVIEEGHAIGLGTQDDVYSSPGLDDGHVVPLEVEPLPFAFEQNDIGYDNPRYYRVKDTGDWIYSYWRSTRRGASMDLYCRAGAQMPSPERATQIFLAWGYPLPGEAFDAQLVTDDASLVRAAVQAIESEGLPPDSLPRLREAGSLQLRSEDYPGVGINYRLQRDRKAHRRPDYGDGVPVDGHAHSREVLNDPSRSSLATYYPAAYPCQLVRASADEFLQIYHLKIFIIVVK